MSESEIAANVIGFFAAGYETTASLLNYTAYVLAMNPHIDQKLYEEIKRVVEEGVCTVKPVLSGHSKRSAKLFLRPIIT